MAADRKAIWETLDSLARSLETVSMRDLFADDPARAARYSLEAAGLFLDYSKNKVNADVMTALCDLAAASDVEGGRRRMLGGEKINQTEMRAVLHVALRDFAARSFHVDGQEVSREIVGMRRKMEAFVERVLDGRHKGYTGQTLDTVVNIGIGGSDLGPQMVCEALRPYWIDGRRTFFVSNIDGEHLRQALAQIDPARTLFLVASKTFTTQETITNALSAREWFLASGATESDIAKHFAALSANGLAVQEFGIDPENMFAFWDWVGGRYSLWSAIGLSIALQTGWATFKALLRGAHEMDEHFRIAPLDANMPILLALIGIWNRNFLGAGAHAILPYDQRLHRFPAYLQQADMESNGKRVSLDGAPVERATGPVIFGEAGTNGQHAFYQLIHQGTDLISSDFIAAARTHAPLGDHHEKLLANFLAQPEALMTGKPESEVKKAMEDAGFSATEIDALAPHKVFPGGRPSNAIIMDQLTPAALGALIALYEHKIFCQGMIWGVNSFDQWGVELGKALASRILPNIAAIGEERPVAQAHDSSTTMLLDRLNAWRAAAKPQ